MEDLDLLNLQLAAEQTNIELQQKRKAIYIAQCDKAIARSEKLITDLTAQVAALTPAHE